MGLFPESFSAVDEALLQQSIQQVQKGLPQVEGHEAIRLTSKPQQNSQRRLIGALIARLFHLPR